MNFGLNEDLREHLLYARQDKLRCNIARFGCPWQAPDTQPLAEGVPYLASLGQRALINVGGIAAPPDAATYASAFSSLWMRYPDALFQVWNEPNIPTFGALPASLVREMHQAVFQATGGRRVIGAPMSPAPGWKNYAREAYRDVLLPPSLHIYPDGAQPMAEVNGAVALAREISDLPIHVSEIGFQRKHYLNQGTLSAQAYKILASQSDVHTVVFHRLVKPVTPSQWETNARLWLRLRDGTTTGIYAQLAGARA